MSAASELDGGSDMDEPMGSQSKVSWRTRTNNANFGLPCFKNIITSTCCPMSVFTLFLPKFTHYTKVPYLTSLLRVIRLPKKLTKSFR